jgi:hypothetical protein
MPWIHYQFEAQGKPVNALLDTQFAEAPPPIDKLPRLAWFGVYLRQPGGKSWWQRSEERTLQAIEHDLIRLCDAFGNGWAVYVRRLETHGFKEYYVYFGGNADLQQVLPALQALHKNYRIEFESRSDPVWSHYKSWIEEHARHG